MEPQKNNLGDEHRYYFENGRWISSESGTPDPNTTNSEGKLSRLVTLVDHIQPPKGVKGDSWDYFYYVFATENSERFEVNANNPAIGFEARNKKEKVFPRAGNNGVRFWYKISWKATEPDKRRFEKGDFVEIEKWENSSSNNKHSTLDKKISISIIKEFFREYNVKSIEINSSNDLIVNYNNGNSEVISNDERGSGIIKNSLQRVLHKSKLDQQELEKLLIGSHSQGTDSSTTSPKTGYLPYLIGGGLIIGILGIVWISFCLRWKKKK